MSATATTTAARSATASRTSRYNWSVWALYAVLTVACLINLFPLLWVFLSSFKHGSEIYGSVLDLPLSWSWDNYAVAWERGNLGTYTVNSILITVPTLFVVLLVGAMAAYVLAKVSPNRIVYSYFVVGIIIPVHVILIPTFILMKQIGLTNNPWALVLLYSATNLPLAVFVLVGFMRSIPDALEEAALIDGASRARIFFSIILPISRPGLAIVGTLTFLNCWNEYLLALVMISTRESKTLPQGVQALRGQFTTDYGLITAGLVISIIPVIVIYVLFQEQFIKGATAGSTTGN